MYYENNRTDPKMKDHSAIFFLELYQIVVIHNVIPDESPPGWYSQKKTFMKFRR